MYLISLQRSGLGYSSIHNISGVIRPAFQMAMDDDMILKNPFDFEMSSVLINDSNKREALSPQDQKLCFIQRIDNRLIIGQRRLLYSCLKRNVTLY